MTDATASDEPDIEAGAAPHDTSYWSEHPDVVTFDAEEHFGDEPGVDLAFWLREAPAGEEDDDSEAISPEEAHEAPSRGPDIELMGEGEAHPTFWNRCPRVEYMEVAEDIPDEEMPNGWWAVRIWLTSTLN